MASGQGAQSILYMEPGSAPHTFDGDSELYVYDSESLQRIDEINDAHGMRGTRSRHFGRVTRDRYTAGGNVTLRPGQLYIENLIDRILGGTTAGGTTPLAETLPEFGILVNKVAGNHAYTDCKVNQAVFSGSSGQSLQLSLDLFAKTEDQSETISSAPTFTSADNQKPIVFSGGTLTLAGSTREFESFTLTVNNALMRHFRNSETALSIDEQDRIVTLSLQLPWTSVLRTALYDLGEDGTASALLKFSAATGDDITFKFGTLAAPRETPTIGGKGDIPFNLNFQAYQDNNDRELEVTIG